MKSRCKLLSSWLILSTQREETNTKSTLVIQQGDLKQPVQLKSEEYSTATDLFFLQCVVYETAYHRCALWPED